MVLLIDEVSTIVSHFSVLLRREEHLFFCNSTLDKVYASFRFYQETAGPVYVENEQNFRQILIHLKAACRNMQADVFLVVTNHWRWALPG